MHSIHLGLLRAVALLLGPGVVMVLVATSGLAADTPPPGRIAEGKMLTTDRSKGNCLACHRIEDGALPGDLGPPLLAMKLRFPDRGVLKEQICDATVRNPNSRMPPFCRHGILTGNEVELIIDYLYTL